MAESKRIYEIKIEGLQESYEGVKSLREALNTLTDTVVNVSEQEQKTASTRKETASGTDALAKATQKLAEWDRSYQTELALVNKELSDNKKEIKDAIKLQEAQATVDAKQLDTYTEKQHYLSALNTLIRNHSTATEEDRAAIERMVKESAELQAELKNIDAQMKIYTRNVGNYNEAADMVVNSQKSVRAELKSLQGEMTNMLVNGVSRTDEGYRKLVKQARALQDALGDVKADISEGASDTRALDGLINVAQSATSAWQLYNSVVALTGSENEEATESMKKMMAIMGILNSLQQVQNSLLENGSLTGRLYTKAVELIQAALGLKKTATEADIATTEASTAANEANAVSQEANAAANEASAVAEGVETAATEANTVATGANTGALGTNTGALGANATASQGAAAATNSMSVAQKAGAVASKTLSVALRAIPLMAIIGLVMALIQNWESIWNWFKKTFPVLDTLSKKFNKLGGFMNAIVTGAKAVAAAVVNWLINPFKTFANVVGKILEGDFSGAWQAALDGVKNQFKGTVDAFKGEIVKGYARGQEEMTAKAAEESNKRTKQELAELKIQERNNKTYSKKYIELQKKDFEERKKMAKGNQEELNKIKLEEMKFDADVEDKKTAYAKSQANERTKTANKAAQDAKKEAEKAQKEYEEWQKKLSELVKKNQKDIEDADKIWLNGLKSIEKAEDEKQKKLVENAKEDYNNRLKVNLEHERTEKALKNQITTLQRLLEVQREIQEKYQSETLAKDIDKTTQALQEARQAYLDFIDASTLDRRHSEGPWNYGKFYEWEDIYKFGLKSVMTDIEKFYAKRTELAVNSFAKEQVERKNTYIKQQDELKKNIEQFEKDLKKARTDAQRYEINENIKNAQDELKLLKQAFEGEFGKYMSKKIDIPVDLDITRMEEQYDKIIDKFGYDLPITITELVQARLGITEKISKDVKTIEEVWNNAIKGTNNELGILFQTLKSTLNLGEEETKNLYRLIEDKEPFSEISEELMGIITSGNVNLKQFGTLYTEAVQKVADLQKSIKDELDKNYTDLISKQDKIISNNEKLIKNFQDAAKGLKFEPAMKDDGLSGILKGQIIDLDKTRERYLDLEFAYEEYLDSIKEGSEQMKAREDAWQLKLEATKQKYGENSMEYKLMVDEKEKSDAAYAIEYEKVTQQIEEISKKQADLMYDYIESIANRFADITKTIQDNVLSPIFDGLSDLFAFQLEEAQDALDEITELYDKAVEAREESADRMKQINDELRADEGQNKEALQQRLAEEEVLLVQREEAERALAKEKAKREYEVEMADYNQRKFELGQKLAEGIVNTALGATAALKYGFPLGPVFAAIITAMGALQTAIITKQIGNLKKPVKKFGFGGLVGEQGVSRSHKQGGHRIEDTNIEVEGGEWVINRKSSKKYDSLLRSINDDNVGLVQKQVEIIRERRIINNGQPVRFADGGQINTLAATRAVRDNNDITAITDLIKQIDFEPTVSVVDINRKNKNLVRVQQYAGKAG